MEELEVWKEKAKAAEVIISSLSDMLKAWKNRAKTAEAKVDNLEKLLKRKDEALKPFVEKFEGTETTDKFVKRIGWYNGEKAAKAYYLDKTEGD